MSKNGRPTKFDKTLSSRIMELAKRGATDEEIARSVGVSVATLNNWKGNKPGFLEALKACKNVADSLVEAALFQRAVGYSHPAVKIFCSEGMIFSEPYIEHYAPDTVACIFWLKNRQREQWRDSKDFKISKEDAIKVLEDELNREESDSGASAQSKKLPA